MNADKDRFQMVVGAKLREIREEAKLSQRQLGAAVGASQNTIATAEDGGACSLYLLAKIAGELDVTLDELVPIEALMPEKDEAAE
jgi:transcriptional regulator with XRE-family HTH domain